MKILIVLFTLLLTNSSNAMTISLKSLLEEGRNEDVLFLSLNWSFSHTDELDRWKHGKDLPSLPLQSTLLSVSESPVEINISTIGADNFFSKMGESDVLDETTLLKVGHKFLFNPSDIGFEGNLIEFYCITNLPGLGITHSESNSGALDRGTPQRRIEKKSSSFVDKLSGFSSYLSLVGSSLSPLGAFVLPSFSRK